MNDPRRDERWKDAFRLARRVARIEKRLKQKNALLPQHKQKPIKKDKRYKEAVHAFFMANINALRSV
jgi:hypothetical protein